MTFKELLVQWLTGDTVIGPIVGKRVYDTYIPQGDPATIFPCLTYQVVSRQHLKNLQGNAGTYYPRVQLTAWSLKSNDTEAIVERLFSLEGVLTLSAGGKSLRWLWVEDGQDDAEAPTQQDERAVRSGAVDLVIWYDG